MHPKAMALLAAFCVCAHAAVALPPAFYVAPNGNDAWSGKLPDPNEAGSDGPFATLQHAQQALRRLLENPGLPKGARVYVREGVYVLAETWRFDARDGGPANDLPVVWQAHGYEKPRLLAGVRLTGFEPHNGEILRCDCSGLDLPKAPKQLFFNGKRQALARWPNKGIGHLPGGGWAFIAASVEDAKNRAFHYAGQRPEKWAHPETAEVSIWPNYNWWQAIAPIADVDTESKRIELAEDLPYTIEPGRRYFVRNVQEELDAPGEWYYDTDEKALYFWPPAPIDGAEVFLPRLEHAIQLDGAQNLNLIGFTIEASRGDAVSVAASEACLLAKHTIRNAGGYAVAVRDGHSVRIHGCDIDDTGKGGIILAGGDRKILQPGGHEAVNNHIHHFAQVWKTYQTAINISGVGNRAAHNLIHDAPHIGIILNGNDHIIEYNDIHHVCLEGSDNGAFYMGRDWTQRGNILRFNRFHDVYGFGLAGLRPQEDGSYRYETPHQAWGIYLDDCSSGTEIYGNLFYRIPLCGVMIGGGRDNNVVNNVFVDCVPALHIDDRWDAFCWDVMQERLDAMNYREAPYSVRYPKLLEMGEDPRKPENNRFERNIVAYTPDTFRGLSTTAEHPKGAVVYDFDQFDPESTHINGNIIWHGGKDIRVNWSVYKDPTKAETLNWKQWREKGFDTASKIMDPKFADPANDGYALARYSPAANTGFVPLPLRKIGLYKNEFRASWPPPVDQRSKGAEHQSFQILPGGQP